MERIQHLNIEFRTEVKKERYRLNLSLSSRLRATNQNLYEVFQIRLVYVQQIQIYTNSLE